MSRASVPPGLALLAMVLVWTAAADHGFAQRPPPGSPDAKYAERTTTPAISGTVRDATTGAPLAGAVVSLGRSTSIAAGRQVTDEAGRFLFANLQIMTTYELMAARPGYFDGAYGVMAAGGVPREIKLTSNEWVSNADISLLRPSALSGRVTSSSGEPLTGVRVAVLTRTVVAGTPVWVRGPGTTTDDRGAYRITALIPGEYVVVVPSVPMTVPEGAPLADRSKPAIDPPASGDQGASSRLLRHRVFAGGWHLLVDDDQPPMLLAREGDRPRGYVTTFHPGVRAIGASGVALGPGEERTGVDVQLQPVPLFRISGAVEAPAGVNRRVKLLLMPRGSDHLGLGHETAMALADARGRFTLANVPAGSYTILAGGSIGGYSDLRGSAASVGRLGSIAWDTVSGIIVRNMPAAVRSAAATVEPAVGRQSVNVADADLEGVVVPLEPGVSIRGVLVREGSPPSLSSATLADYARTVYAEPAGGEPILGRPSGLASGAGPSRTFSIDGVVPGEYLLSAAGTVKSVLWNGRDYADTPLSVPPRTGLSGVVVTTTSETAYLSGSVHDAQGEAALGATVICFPADPARWRRNGVAPTRFRSGVVHLNAVRDGIYMMLSLPAGEYYVLAVSEPLPRTWQDPTFLAKAAGVATRVRLDWGGKHTQDLTVAAVSR